MAKGMTFTDNEEDLIKRIQKYQEEKKLNSFAAAVRELCKKGLTIEELKK